MCGVRGFFVTFEGVDGSGKTTVANLVAEYLRRQGLPVLLTSEPNTVYIKQLLMTTDERTAWTETFLFLADRAEHVAKVIKPALQRGEIVLCDRFIDSTIAYQGFGLGLPVEQLMQLNNTATGGLIPNLTILLDIEPEIGLRRSQRETIFERRSLEFHERVRCGYLWLASREPHRIKIVDASQPLESVIEQTLQILTCSLQSLTLR
jgi:dTMP kinase